MNFVMTPLKDLLLKVEKWNPAKEAGDMLIKYIDLSSVDKDSKQLIADEVQELFGSKHLVVHDNWCLRTIFWWLRFAPI